VRSCENKLDSLSLVRIPINAKRPTSSSSKPMFEPGRDYKLNPHMDYCSIIMGSD
jgi:hypothetical protein